ncbi:alpha/beta fold hydrolase [Parvicella tangerina]|uniref:alpha/beta fold hydrolase n=1 Tax=Parvicella tangerina TaxID=2829795 RepID=UPI00215B8667|nr:alpha/beta hydrolase [Parvicella tangerina]
MYSAYLAGYAPYTNRCGTFKKDEMNIYGISGLGADKRVFERLSLEQNLIPIDWIDPEPNESIESYSNRLKEVIDTSEPFILIGVSFGGLIATEISKILNPELTILISSAETKNELRSIYRGFGKTNLIKLIPNKLFDMPRGFATFMFGTNEKKLLSDILDDTDLKFTKWAINELTNWKNETKLEKVVKINGSKDKLIPPSQSDYLIDGGEHFMVVDKADEISTIINNEIKKYVPQQRLK